MAAEDTRRTSVLLRAHDITTTLIPHHAHNEHREVDRLVARLMSGERGALVTDAGTPGLSDPGFLLLRACRRESVRVDVLPGASAVTTALLLSGFPPEPFLFIGYLPATATHRARTLEALREEVRTVVCFESPHRLRACLEDLDRIMSDRPLAVLREMTKLHEEVSIGLPAELLVQFDQSTRGEIVLVLAPRTRRGAWYR